MVRFHGRPIGLRWNSVRIQCVANRYSKSDSDSDSDADADADLIYFEWGN